MKSERTRAEYVTLAACIAVVAVVVGLILLQLPNEDGPPAPVTNVDGVAKVGDDFHVSVTVSNDGGGTAANVQVNASLDVDGEVTEADQTIDFLASDDEEELVFVFADDPDSGELTVAVGGFAIP
ncbi:MAG: CARDB domain-containing protein [Microthrixaceae bacterium]